MKVNGPMYSQTAERHTDAHIAARARQNGKKSRNIRAHTYRKEGMGRNKARQAAILS